MGNPTINIDVSAGIPRFYDVEWLCDTNNDGIIIKNVDLPSGSLIPVNSFLVLAAFGEEIGEGPNSPSIQSTGLRGIQVLKQGTTQIKFRANLRDASNTDIFNIPVTEVPTQKAVYQHELTYTTPGSLNADGDTFNIAAATPGFTPGSQEATYAEGSPVLWAMGPGRLISQTANESFHNIQLLTFIKADGSFDMYGVSSSGNTNEPYPLWVQVMAI